MINSDAFQLKFNEHSDINLIDEVPRCSNYDTVLKQHYLPDLPKDLQDRYDQLYTTAPQNLETFTTAEDLTRYHCPIRYEVKMRKVVSEGKGCTTTIYEEYRAKRVTNIGKRRQNKLCKYKDVFRIGDLLYRRSERGLLIPEGRTGIAWEEKKIRSYLVEMQAQTEMWKRHKKREKEYLKQPQRVKMKSIIWKEVFEKWKRAKGYKGKRKKVKQEQLDELGVLYDDEVRLKMA
jgi:hypothetical protein